jgi:hypothetical protein
MAGPLPPGEYNAPPVGWRLWRVSGDRLHSWSVNATWSPGPNQAECLEPVPCVEPPGRRCQCGFWALWSAEACYDRVCAGHGSVIVMGLVSAWGIVALHGREGFRAQHAAVRCLFSDPLSRDGHSRLATWILTKLGHPELPHHDAERLETLQRVASAYGVPLLSVADAERFGVLSELGPGSEVSASAGRGRHFPPGWMRRL